MRAFASTASQLISVAMENSAYCVRTCTVKADLWIKVFPQ
jgi:hypothetical protein